MGTGNNLFLVTSMMMELILNTFIKGRVAVVGLVQDNLFACHLLHLLSKLLIVLLLIVINCSLNMMLFILMCST